MARVGLRVAVGHLALGAAQWGLLFAVARRTEPAPSSEYFLTEHLFDAWSHGLAWIAPAQVVLGFLASLLARARWSTALAACVGFYFLPVVVEFARDMTSHNLIPFELGFYALTCAPIVLGAALGSLRRRKPPASPSA